MPQTLQIAQTILEQLGGRRFIVMTGAKAFVGSSDALTFRLPGGGGFTRDGINCVKVTLTAMDDYVVEFLRIRAGVVKSIATHTGIYCDQLQDVFTTATGLRTSLTHA